MKSSTDQHLASDFAPIMTKTVYDEDRRKRRAERTLLRGAIKKATKKNDKVPLLVKYLRERIADIKKEDPQLLDDLKEHFEMLADLIAPPAKKRGRPKGRDQSERAQAVSLIVYMVRELEREWLKKNPNKSIRGIRPELIAQVFAMPVEDDDRFSFSKPITEDEVHAALNRGGSSRKIRN
jgi:hypothetical protein